MIHADGGGDHEGTRTASRRARERERRLRERQRRARRRRLAAGAALIGLAAVIAGLASLLLSADPTASRPGSGATRAHALRPRAGRLRPGTRYGSTVSPTARGTGVPGTMTVPILMYHVINPPPAGALFPGLYVPAPEFADQMQALRRAGWRPVTTDQLQAYWTRGVPLGPGRPIVLTFDNGYASQYTNAMPILRRLGWVGVENMQLSGLPKSQGGLTDSQVRGLLRAGWELDTQGIDHADLIAQTPSQLRYQVLTARQILRRRYHVPVNWFCYPSGHYDQTVIDEVRAAGYVGSTTVVPGWGAAGEDRFRLPRLRVLGGTSGTALLHLIAQYEHASVPPGTYGGA